MTLQLMDSCEGDTASRQNKQKDHLIMANALKHCNIYKHINSSKNFGGVDRSSSSNLDQFVLTRVLNRPELIFNQKPQTDHDEGSRFFKADAASRWEMSLNTECFSCDKHIYVQVHYQRGLFASNADLVEITDKELIEELHYQYKKEFLKYRTTTPLICGSLVKRLPGQGLFERKLKMLRTTLYCLLAVSRCRHFSDSKEEYQAIEEGVLRYLKTDAFELLEQMEMRESMDGWRHVLSDLALNNELADMRVINLPDLNEQNIEKQDWFTFGGFVAAGYHQLLIFDPKYKRAYCKDLVIKLNKRDQVYPEYPSPPLDDFKKHVPNMWAAWIEDTIEDYSKMFKFECNEELFNIDKYVKNQEDQDKCKSMLVDNLDIIIIMQKYLIIESTKFPQIDWESMISYLEEVQESELFNHYTANKLQRAQFELIFISSTRTDGVKGLQGDLQRGELLDFLMRSAQQWVRQEYGYREMIYNHMNEFLQAYVEPASEFSKIEEQRIVIRKSKRLNELLFDNNKGLLEVFEHFKISESGRAPQFTFAAAKLFFTSFIGERMMEPLTET